MLTFKLSPQFVEECTLCKHSHVVGDCPSIVAQDDHAVQIALVEGLIQRKPCCDVCGKKGDTVGHVVAGTGTIEWKCLGCVIPHCDWCGTAVNSRNRYCGSSCLVSHWRAQVTRKEPHAA